MNSFSLSLCLYVCLYWPEIFCVQGLVLSAHMYVMVFKDKHILTKWNILSNCLLIYSRERIFHFGRVCLSWKTITYIWAERTRPWTQNISGQYRHTYKQRESHSYQCIHETVQNQVSWCYTNVMKNSNFSVMNNFPSLLTRPKFITFTPSYLQIRMKSLETELEFRSSQNTWHPHTSLRTHILR